MSEKLTDAELTTISATNVAAQISTLRAEVETLKDEVRHLRAELLAKPPFACPTCEWRFQTAALRDKHLALGFCPGIAAAAELTGEWTAERTKGLSG